jgi:predicted glycoside hydrolase/deacetylase ChbG (UPF0249 family)
VALVADDYGYNVAIDRATLALIDAGRLHGAGCMVDGPQFAAAAPALRERAGHADIGLHFNLTETLGDAKRMGTLARVMAQAWTRTIDACRVMQALRCQLDRFESAFDGAPDYIDGHQHVHQFPVVRDVLLCELEHRYGAQRPFLRNTVAPDGNAKARVIEWLGGRDFQRRLRAQRWPTNRDFVGAYGYGRGEDFAHLAQRWLTLAHDGTLWMCHPAASAEPGDPIGKDRVAEFELLRSESFGAWCAAGGVTLVRPTALA